MPTFTAKRVSSNQNVLFPDILEIGNSTVSYHKGYVFGYKTTVIARQNIASVSLDRGLFFTDVIISSKGGERIVAQGFSKSDADQILVLLT